MKLKNIYLIHHSHYDIGFTHSQVVLEQLQTDFINQVLDMLDVTADWDTDSQPRWTIEVHHQLKLWLESATPENIARLKQHVRDERIGLGAIQYNTTPLASLESLCQQLVDLRAFREELGCPAKVAFQHDVTGIPWILSDLLLDAGVEMLVMAINLHTGGNGPVRPGLFKWKTPRGRTLKVFSGHHYSAFDVITDPCGKPVEEMKASMDEHWNLLQELDYPYDFLYLSTTNVPIAYDNGGPSMMTAEKVRAWNQREGYPRIQYVTPEQLIEKLKQVPDNAIREFGGDWSDFWNYGAGSAARETGINANSKQKLFSSALLSLHLPGNERLNTLQTRAWNEVVAMDEHTWGYWAHASHPNHPQCITTEIWKRSTAHTGQELARYVLSSRLSDFAGNPVMSESEGLLAVNPSPVKQAVTLGVPERWRNGLFGRLNGFAFMHSEVTTPVGDDDFSTSQPSAFNVHFELEPFSALRLPWSDCRAPEAADTIREGSAEEAVAVQTLDGHDKEVRTRGNRTIESPFHLLEYVPANGRIVRLYDKKNGWEVLPGSADYNLFEPIHEKPDPRFDASRKSFYDRVVDTEMKFDDCWNEDWKALRTGITEFLGVRVEQQERTVSLVREYRIQGASKIIQKFTLSADTPWIEVDMVMHKDKVHTPESIYFASQVNLEEGWEATYDGSGIPVKLEEEQLPHTSKSWITAEAFTRMEDGHHQFSVFAPGMPLVQFGDFNFGKPREQIPRPAKPLLLNWACNNYWETNFHTTQAGVIRFHCAVYTSKGESNAQIYRMADAFARKPFFLPLAACAGAEAHTLVRVDNPKVRLASIDGSRYHGGMVFRLINTGRAVEQCSLDMMRGIKAAFLVNPVEEHIKDCVVNGTAVAVEVPPNGIVSVLVQG